MKSAPIVRTRFAPSPTGDLHLGGARTALFSWAYAKHHQGVFVLRIEDTDRKRSTDEAVQVILDGMQWLGLEPDEGPFYQSKRIERHKEVIEQMLQAGTAYYCYSTPEEVETMRERARAQGLKPRYDGTWRPEPGKTLPAIPADRQPVVRFKSPQTGATTWQDLVKGPISIPNDELDDLVIARSDGTPTYNFCVVVDDWDMKITHVIRGDDHVNNTARQITMLQALNAEIPAYAHVPMILGPDGEKLSKRHGAVNILEYEEQGFLPEAMVNYLARLGWSHGDAELFSVQQFISWFNTKSLSRSPAQWDPKKLRWVNAHYIKNSTNERLAKLVAPRVVRLGGDPNLIDFQAAMQLLKQRAETLNDLAKQAMIFCQPKDPNIEPKLKEQVVTNEALTLLKHFYQKAKHLQTWQSESIDQMIKELLKEQNARMPHLGIPLRVVVTGQRQTPAIDAVLAIIGQDKVLQRLEKVLH